MNLMARSVEVDKEAVLHEAAEKVQAAFDSHLSKFSPEDQEKKWDALEKYLNEVSSASRAKH